MFMVGVGLLMRLVAMCSRGSRDVGLWLFGYYRVSRGGIAMLATFINEGRGTAALGFCKLLFNAFLIFENRRWGALPWLTTGYSTRSCVRTSDLSVVWNDCEVFSRVGWGQ
jgi:hypothetical protein